MDRPEVEAPLTGHNHMMAVDGRVLTDSGAGDGFQGPVGAVDLIYSQIDGDPATLRAHQADGNTEPPTSDPITDGTPLLLLSGAYEFDVTSAAGAEGLHLAVFGGLLA